MSIEIDLDKLDFGKGGGLIPAIVQHALTGSVLMLGYMNRAALDASLARRRVVFYSRSKQRLWEKGETSGYFLELEGIRVDCDADTLLVTAQPRGPVCHLGTLTCFGDDPVTAVERLGFIAQLENTIAQRFVDRPPGSYTSKLFEQGVKRIAQKVGEEGVEVALAAVGEPDDKVIGESADLMFHLLVLLKGRGLTMSQVVTELAVRHKA